MRGEGMRSLVTSLLELAGLALIVAGVAYFSAPLGLISAGCALVVIGLRQA